MQTGSAIRPIIFCPYALKGRSLKIAKLTHMNGLLQLTEKGGEFFIDSRIVSEGLGIQHKNLIATVSKYISNIESHFGQVAFETETVQNTAGAVNQVKFCLLSEAQALFIGTLSRNTEKVIEFKALVVKSFQAVRAQLTKVKEVVKPAVEKLEARVRQLEAKLASNERTHQNEIKNLQFRLSNNQSQLEFYQNHSKELRGHWREAEERYFRESDRSYVMLEELLELRDRVKALKPASEAPAAGNALPELSKTTQVRIMVDEHCKRTGLHQEAVWNELYLLMYYHYSLSVNRWTRPKGVSKLQEIERRGHGDKLLALATQHFANSQMAA